MLQGGNRFTNLLPIVQASCELHSLKVATGEKDLVSELMAYALTRCFSHASHQCGHDSLSPIAVYTVTGRPQYCNHLGPAPEESSVRVASRNRTLARITVLRKWPIKFTEIKSSFFRRPKVATSSYWREILAYSLLAKGRNAKKRKARVWKKRSRQ